MALQIFGVVFDRTEQDGFNVWEVSPAWVDRFAQSKMRRKRPEPTEAQYQRDRALVESLRFLRLRLREVRAEMRGQRGNLM